jgi:DNA-binding transcriptional MerR regulator
MNPVDPSALTLEELAELSRETPRTIRYYVEKGLLASPGLGRSVRYGPELVDRLRLIQVLQQLGLPLARIRERLEKLSPADVPGALANANADLALHQTSQGRLSGSPAEYAERLLDSSRRSRSSQTAATLPTTQGLLFEEPVLPASQSWDRYALSPDVEIHVRRPLSNPDQRKLRQLVRFGLELFESKEQQKLSLSGPSSGQGEKKP